MISIIVPVYNVEQYIEEAVNSVVRQTYTDWELLLVNDGSTDQSLKLCREFEKLDSRIHVIDRENGGVSSARNAGLERARGEWVGFLDGDDWLEENCLETALSRVDGDTDVVCWNYWKNTGDRQKKNKPIDPPCMEFHEPKELIKLVMFPQYALKTKGESFGEIRGVTTKIIRTRLLRNNHLRFDTKVKIGEDALFSAKCFEHARKVVFMDEYLYHYRTNFLSATKKCRPDIREVYINTLEEFHVFLDRYKDSGIALCYGGLTYDCVARALEQYYFHPENKKPLRRKLTELTDYLNDPHIRKGISGITDLGIFYMKQKLVILCSRYRFAAGLYVLSLVKRSIKGLTGEAE